MNQNHVPMTAPQGNGGSKRERRNDIQVIPGGIHPVVLYSIIDLGTQQTVWQGKTGESRKIKFTFEFPMFKQMFFVDDTTPSPSVLSLEFSYMMYVSNGKKTKLLEFVESLIGRVLQNNEHNTFDISTLLDKHYTATVVHYLNQKGSTSAKITTAVPIDFNLYQNHFNSGALNRTNNVTLFSLNHGFESAAFASVDYYHRTQIKKSNEGQQHSYRGGKFVKFDQNNNLIYDDSPMPVQDNNTPGNVYQNQTGNIQQPQQGYNQPQQQYAQQPQAQPNYNQQYGVPQNSQPQQYAPQGQQQNNIGNPQQQYQQQPVQQASGGYNQPQGQPVQQQQQYQPQQGYSQQPQNTAQMTQPQQPSQPQTVNPGMAQNLSPAQQFVNGGQPTQGMPVQQPQQPSAPVQAQQTDMFGGGQSAPQGYGTGQFNSEEHDDLPF